MGIDIDEADLIKGDGRQYIGKPDFARALVKKRYIENISQAFEPGKYLQSDEAVRADRDKPGTQDMIELITSAKGMAVLAHPCKIKDWECGAAANLSLLSTACSGSLRPWDLRD